jgi:hypothetical protein
MKKISHTDAAHPEDEEWNNLVTIKHLGNPLMSWNVRGRGYGMPICDAVESSQEWLEFSRWRRTVPENEWHKITIEHSFSTTDGRNK